MPQPRVTATTDQPQPRLVGEQLEAALNGLQQRELLEPALLLSAGYVGLPFMLRQGLLLLTPLLALYGFAREREGITRAVSE